MGASEAVYRFLASMKLKNSNITTTFVQTGFPENRTIFFKKVFNENESDIEDIEEDDNQMEEGMEDETNENVQCKSQPTVRLKDKDGKFKQGNPIHDR